MAAEKLFNKPSNKIVQGDYLGPRMAQIGYNATAAYMVPGRVVAFDTSDNCVKEGTDPSGNVGILGYEDTPPFNQPTDGITGAYAQGDKVAIHNSIGMFFKGWLATGLTVNPGTSLKVTSAGTFTTLALATDKVNAVAMETVTSSGVTACWMQWRG